MHFESITVWIHCIQTLLFGSCAVNSVQFVTSRVGIVRQLYFDYSCLFYRLELLSQD